MSCIRGSVHSRLCAEVHYNCTLTIIKKLYLEHATSCTCCRLSGSRKQYPVSPVCVLCNAPWLLCVLPPSVFAVAEGLHSSRTPVTRQL